MIEAERVPQRGTLIGRGWKDTECKSYPHFRRTSFSSIYRGRKVTESCRARARTKDPRSWWAEVRGGQRCKKLFKA